MTQVLDAAEVPTVTGPVSGGLRGWVFGTPTFDVNVYGYREDEFFLEGIATRYRLVSDGERRWDGRWQAEPAQRAAFKTRFVVYRPVDPSHFNGTVLLMWNNVSSGFDTLALNAGKLQDGYCVVTGTVQRVAMVGMGEHPAGLVSWDPERYGRLSLPSDDYSFDIFTQIARTVGRTRTITTVDPLGGLEPVQVIAYGSSQAAARLASYINAVHPIAKAVNGFVLGGYFGSGVPLEVGDTVLDPADPESRRLILGSGPHLLRDDLDVPVIVVNSESETLSYYKVRQPDSDRFRFWEVAGASHAAAPEIRAMAERSRRDLGFTYLSPEGLNEVSPIPVVDAAFHHMRSWAVGGPPPPMCLPIDIAGEPPQIVRDEDGIASGGVRLPQVEVPIGFTTFPPEVMLGIYKPFPVDDLRARYGDRAGFIDRFQRAAQAAVDAGTLRPHDSQALVERAIAIVPLGPPIQSGS